MKTAKYQNIYGVFLHVLKSHILDTFSFCSTCSEQNLQTVALSVEKTLFNCVEI